VTCATKGWIAPSSTFALGGVTLTAMSLVIVTLAVLLFDGSATLVAVTNTVVG
jgi:hypothetical protein